MFDYRYVYWWGSIFQVLVMFALLINIWRTKNCSGLSLKTQFLYALVFTTRQWDLDLYYIPLENIVIKVIYFIVTYATALSMYRCFSKTYDKENDTSRIDLWFILCLALSLIANDRFDYWIILMSFSFYVEAVAMIPQFQLIVKNGRIDKHVFLYIVGMATYSFLQVAYLSSQYGSSHYSYRIVAVTAQFLPYCEFFRRIYPLLGPQDDDNRPVVSIFCTICSFLRSSEKTPDIEADHMVNEMPKPSGHLAGNVSCVLLTPSSLTGIHKYKGFSEANKEAIGK